MVDGIRSGGGLQREAILAALRSQAEAAGRVRSAAEDVAGRAGASGAEAPREVGGFAEALREGALAVDREVQSAERLPEDLAAGRVGDFHEVAARIKSADLSFKFALEIRNKLVDAYREVMRMSV